MNPGEFLLPSETLKAVAPLGFCILGPLEVHVDGRRSELEGAKARALLALLLVNVNEVVSTDRLIDDLWSGSPPSSAANALQVHVSHLRKLVGREALVTRPPGYVLNADPDTVDARRFERLLELARQELSAGRPEQALAALEEGLGLWRGPALADFLYEPFAQREIGRLEELRQAAVEERIEAHLALGGGPDLVSELDALVAEHPLRERPRGQLMLALYRSGRQAEALELYQQTRRLLVDELGIDPSPSLQRLETAILRQDPSLEAAPRPPSVEAPRPAPSPRELRKTVTVLFLDLASEGGPIDPEPLLEIRTKALETAAEILREHGGTVTELPAGRLMAVFGVPTVREDDVLRAVRAASEFRETLAGMNDASDGAWGVRLLVRIGIETGEVMAGASVAGEAIDVAARLERAAGPGEILAGPGTSDFLHEVATFEPFGGAFLLVDVPPAVGLIPRRETPMVGRSSELAQLERAFERVLAERTPTLFTLLGPAGIGKSRLGAEFEALVADRASVLRGRCPPYGKGITFWPLAEVLRQAAGDTTTEAIASLLGGYPDADVVAARVAAAVGRPDAEAAGHETSWAIRKLLEALARGAPLVLVFDDIQWAEPTFLDFVESVVDVSRDAPIFLLCLARPELLEEQPAWGGGKVNAMSMLLEALSREESEALIANALGDRRLEADARARIADAAEGNPLFLEQMLAMLSEGGGSGEVVLPPTIQALLAARLDRLDDEERIVIERAAIVGREFSQDALAALAEDADDGIDLVPNLERLIRRELVRPGSSLFPEGQGFRFRHSLIREAAYAAIPKRARAGLHERFASWLEAADDRWPKEHEEIIGHHLEQAHLYRVELGVDDERTSELAERAARHLAVVGERAYGRGDGPAAANLLSRAVALLPVESEGRLDLVVDLGEALRESGEFRRAEDVLNEAMERAAAGGDEPREARAFVVRLRLRMQTESDFAAPALLEETEHAIEVLEQVGDERGLAKAWSVRAWFPWLECNAAAAEEAVLRAVDYARRAGDERAEAYGVNLLLGAWLFGPTPVPEAIRRCEEILGPGVRQQRVKASAYRALAGLVAMEGRFDEARDLLEQDRAIIEDVGLRVAAAVAAEIWAILELLAGDPEAAERRLREGYDILEAMGEKSGLSTLAAMLAHALYAQGRYEEALRFTEVAEEAAPDEDRSANVYCLSARAKVLARRGMADDAEGVARRALELAEPTDFLSMRAQAHMDFAEVLRLANREDEAAAAAAAALGLYEQKGNVIAARRARAVRAGVGSPAVLP